MHGTNLTDVQEMNRLLVLRLLAEHRVCSRAYLAKMTGLRQATITNIMSDLINCELVKEIGPMESNKGRRSIGIALVSEKFKSLGVRFDRQFTSVGIFDITGRECGLKTIRNDITKEPRIAFERMKDLIREMLSANETGDLLGIGVAVPGLYIRTKGKIAVMAGFPGWGDIYILDELKQSFGLPVYIEQDSNAGAMAEWWFGRHRGKKKSMVYTSVGNGIGMGVIDEGKLFVGAQGIAGELGHVSIDYSGPKCACGNRGCLTNYCTETALLAEIKREMQAAGQRSEWEALSRNGEISYAKVAEMAQHGAKSIKNAYATIGRLIGIGCNIIVNAYNPTAIIIGFGDAYRWMGDFMLETVRKTVKKSLISEIADELTIEGTSFETDTVLLGAGVLAMDRELSRNSEFIRKIATSVREGNAV